MVGWLKSVVTVENRVWTKGASEMIVNSCLGTLKEMFEEYGVKYRVFHAV